MFDAHAAPEARPADHLGGCACPACRGETALAPGDPVAAALRATADDRPGGDPRARLARVCDAYLALVDAAIEGLDLSAGEWACLACTHPDVEPGPDAALLLGEAVREQDTALGAWGSTPWRSPTASRR